MSDLFRSYLIAAGVHHICYVQASKCLLVYGFFFAFSQSLKRIDLLFMEIIQYSFASNTLINRFFEPICDLLLLES